MHGVVLSGGGNYGAMQAGALEALLEAGLEPDLVVGNSAGALNAIQLAANPSVEGARSMARVWSRVQAKHVGSISIFGGLQRLVLQRESLFPSHPLARFLLENFPSGVKTFGELHGLHGIDCYTLAACLDTEAPRLFGDDHQDSLLDGAMASAALPPYFAPWRVNEQSYVDGGVYTNLPLRAAVERGATELTALWIRPPIENIPPEAGMIRVTSAAFTLMVRNLSGLELAWVQARSVPVRLIELHPPLDVSFWDFSQSERLVEMGRQAAMENLAERPFQGTGWWARLASLWKA